MQDYVIYTFGGGEILWHVMNAIAILFKSENSYFTSVGMLTMAAGLFYATVRALGLNAFSFFFKDWLIPVIFLTGLFFGLKSSVHIVDKVDPDFKYSKVDHIPVGIAAIASLSSQVSEYLTENLETVMTTSDAERFSKVGPMFGARLIHEASRLTIKDPLLRLNIKDFVYQCFEWPYIKSNIAPGRLAAESTQDILGFVESNPHPMLGIYWRQPDGQAAFVNCQACAARVRDVIGIEVDQGMASLAISLFGGNSDPEAITNRLKNYGSNAWNSLAKGSGNLANTIQQQLMLNSYHAAVRNKNDELDLGRYDAALIHLEAERGQAVQDTTSLVKSSLSLIALPNLHTIVLAISLIFFGVIAPLSLLPQGIRYITMWVKVMVWVTTWPVFFTLLNCIGQMFAAKALGSSLMGYGEGLTIQTQNGLANTAYSAYCTVMGLQYMVAFLSWTLISHGVHGISQLASSFTQTGEGFAGRVGNELVDGNVSFDSQTLHHRSIANAQIAQQQLGASFNYGSRYDDGKVSLLHGASGSVVAQEHQHSFGTNVSHNDAFSHMYALQSQTALAAANQQGISMQHAVTSGTQELYSFARSVAESKGINESFGNSESAQFQKQMQDLINLSDRFAEDNRLDKQVAFDALVGANLGSGNGIGKMFGINASGSFKASASDNENISKAHGSEIMNQFSDSLNQAVNYALDNKASISKNFNTQSLDQAQAHFSTAATHADSMSAHLTDSKTFSEMANHSRQSGTSSVTNANNTMVEKIAQQFDGDSVAAAQYLAYHPQLGKQTSSNLIDQAMRRQTAPTSESIKQFHKNNVDEVGAAPTNNSMITQMRSIQDIDGQESFINQTIRNSKLNTSDEIKKSDLKTINHKKQIQHQNKSLEATFENESHRTLFGKSVGKVGGNIKDFKKQVIKYFMDQ